jgi:hypothetical protein
MARKSFTLRLVDPGVGSYVQYPDGSEAASVGLGVLEDDYTKLRSDDLQASPVLSEPTVPGTLTPTIAYFESTVFDHNELRLGWDVALASVLTLTPQPTRVLIVYSYLGEPQTIADGLVIVNTNTVSSITHNPDPGKWAYYSMFLRYENVNGNVYYDKAASIAELMPYDYGCSEDMYSKIPEYYRTLDDALDTGNGGPLRRMISLFGFEADRARTAIDYLIACKDPLIAHTAIVDILAKDLSVQLRCDELGTARLRGILNDVGTIRRALGTPTSVGLIVQGATGSDAEIDFYNQFIKIYAQRVNLIRDPSIVGGAAGSFSGGSPRTTQFVTTFDAGGASVPSVTESFEGGDPYSSLTASDEFAEDPGTVGRAYDDPIDGNQFWVYFPDLASAGSVAVLQTLQADAPVIGGDRLYFSMHGDFIENAQEDVLRVGLYAAGSGAASAGYSGTNNDVMITQSTNPIVIGGVRYWELSVPASITAYTPAFLTLFIKNSANVRRGFQRMLLERFLGGSYFDGDSAEGGWLVDYPSTTRISDYRWYDDEFPNDNEGPAEQSYSVYNSNYQKTRVVAKRFLPQILPVTQISYSQTVYSNDISNITTPIWNINWNAVPGVEYNYSL